MMIVVLMSLFLQSPTGSPVAIAAYQDGLAAANRNKHADALEFFDRAIALSPDVGRFHHARCRTLGQLRRHQEAVESCSRALSSNSSAPAILIDRGHYAINARRLDLAVEDLSKAASMGADSYDLYFYLGFAQYVKGSFLEAAATYEKCVKVSPNRSASAPCLAWQYVAWTRAGKVAQAEALLRSWEPDRTVPENAYTDMLMLFKGHKTEAQVEKTMTGGAQRSMVSYVIGVWHLLQGRTPEAVRRFNEALDNPADHSSLGAIASHFEIQRVK